MNLSDIFSTDTATAFDAAAPADNLPLPPGEYDATLDAAGPHRSRQGTPGYKLTFRIIGGPHHGRRVWHEVYFTDKALGYAKKDLMTLGVTSFAQLEKPDWHRGIRCRLKLAVHKTDGGGEYNRVKDIALTGRDTHPADLFPPASAQPAAVADPPPAAERPAEAPTAPQPAKSTRSTPSGKPSPAKKRPAKGKRS